MTGDKLAVLLVERRDLRHQNLKHPGCVDELAVMDLVRVVDGVRQSMEIRLQVTNPAGLGDTDVVQVQTQMTELLIEYKPIFETYTDNDWPAVYLQDQYDMKATMTPYWDAMISKLPVSPTLIYVSCSSLT